MLKCALLIAALISVVQAEAAIPKSSAPQTSSKPALEKATQEALALPLNERIELLTDQGPDGYRNLVKIMFTPAMKMETRWRAVMAVGRIGGAESRKELERALRSPEWYMRNAGLVALANIDRKAALDWARRLSSDKALVVRAAAVETMVELHASESTSLLWQKLYAKENFRHQQSLFIRRRIVEALAMLEKSGSEAKFVAILADKDPTLHPHAIRALERMTQASVTPENAPVGIKRERWQQWWKEKAQAKL